MAGNVCAVKNQQFIWANLGHSCLVITWRRTAKAEAAQSLWKLVVSYKLLLACFRRNMVMLPILLLLYAGLRVTAAGLRSSYRRTSLKRSIKHHPSLCM